MHASSPYFVDIANCFYELTMSEPQYNFVYCFKGTPFLALTGTADKSTLNIIQKSLVLKDPVCIFVSPERKNIRFSVKKLKQNEMFEQLSWLVQLIKDAGIHCPKTLIFCNTLNDIAAVFNNLMLQLGPCAYHLSDTNPECRIIGMYHSNSFKEHKERLFLQFKRQGYKRVIVTSSSLSMGVNFPDIKYVINWGPARNLLDQLQEGGRAGHNGEPAHVIIIYHGRQLSHCNSDVKEFVNTNGCYRVAAYRPFDSMVKPGSIKHDCCNFCSQSCLCCKDGCPILYDFEKKCTGASTSIQSDLIRPVTNHDKEILRTALQELMSQVNGRAAVFDKVASHGFSSQLICDIVDNSHRIFTLNDIVSHFPIFSVVHAYKILEVINELFMDIPETSFEQTSDLTQVELYVDLIPFEQTLDNYFKDLSVFVDENEL